MPGKLSKVPPEEARYVKSICIHCDFYQGSADELECAGFKILKKLLETEVITLADISNAKID